MDNRPPPEEDHCEIFIGKLPRDVVEDEIYPLFSSIGQIFESRLMMDFSGSNRGYAFIMYTNAEDAKKACKTFDGYEIRPGRKIGVCESHNNSRLKIGNLPPDCGISDFCEVRTFVLKNFLLIYKLPISQLLTKFYFQHSIFNNSSF